MTITAPKSNSAVWSGTEGSILSPARSEGVGPTVLGLVLAGVLEHGARALRVTP